VASSQEIPVMVGEVAAAA